MTQHKANLDAWHVLRTVIDAGGFAQAAKQLQRSQSAISYSISKLQEQIGLELLTLQGRRAVLTAHGALLLERTRALLTNYDDILQLADELQKGHEPALSIWIDGHCPTWFLSPVFGEFQTHFPQTALTIHQGGAKFVPGDGPEEKIADQIDLAITTRPLWATGYSNIGELHFTAVAHPNHPLFGCDSPIEQSVLEQHRQVQLDTVTARSSNSTPAVKKQSIWLVSSLHQALEAVLMGQAYGWLPIDLIESELTQGKLIRLSLEHGESYSLPVYLQYNKATTGPAAQTMGELISRYFSQRR